MALIYKNKIIKEILVLDTYYATGEEDLYDSKMIELNAVLATIDDMPTVDAVPKSACDQIKWKRDIAISQLESYGVQLGENFNMKTEVCAKWYEQGLSSFKCFICGAVHDSKSKFCPNCGFPMYIEQSDYECEDDDDDEELQYEE